MSSPALDLVTLLDIERLEVDLFRGLGESGETRPRQRHYCRLRWFRYSWVSSFVDV